jgi:exopolyphosphatase/guanosine-5'-triphosphate,3'-diphosphate pyrophosphatase
VRVAAIDCGTNSVRLLVADLTSGGKADVHREMQVVRLGEGVDRTGVLSEAALGRTRVALTAYAGTCRDLGVEQTRMVATSATRDAGNRDVFVAMVEAALGVTPEVISGEEEAALSFTGATRSLAGGGPFLVLDIGGGSTELVLGDGAVLASRSIDVGCVRLTERHLRDDPPSAVQVAAARSDVAALLEPALDHVGADRAGTVVGLAGSVTTVAAVALGLSAYQPEVIHGSRLATATVHEVTDRLLQMTRAERAALPVMHPGRVDVIGGGALVLAMVMERVHLDELLVSESDILDGIALSMLPRLR